MSARWLTALAPLIVAAATVAACNEIAGIDAPVLVTDQTGDDATTPGEAGADAAAMPSADGLAAGDSARRYDAMGDGDAASRDATSFEGSEGADAALPLGAPCGADDGAAACVSGHCVDGVCCDVSCTGACEACDVGSGGKCLPVVSGQPHGARAACAGVGATCGGACAAGNAAGCTYPGSSTPCRAASCTAGIATQPAACDGSGGCPAPATVPCNPAACNAAGTACQGACSTDADCTSLGRPYCNGGTCLATKGNGETCAGSSECTSTHCVDGYCCNSACAGQCQACDVTGNPGACMQVPSGQPHGTRPACVGAGTAPCGGSCTTATATACTYPSVSCSPASCNGATAVAATSCSNGTCPAGRATPCAPYQCNPATATCYMTCATDADCAATDYCAATGFCVSEKGQGATCNTAAGADCKTSGCRECGTAAGGCVGGSCCDTTCGGQCQSCAVAGSVGTCKKYPANTSGNGCAPGTECNGMATTCVACPVAPASAAHYVDPVSGVDNASAGVGTGACAFRTITYALTQATAQINLAPGNYTVASGETFPIVLNGTQSLNGTRAAILKGNGPASAEYTVSMQGSANTINGFTLINSGLTDFTTCVQTASSTEGIVTNMDISGCPIGLAAKTTFQFIGNNVHDMNNTTNMYLAGVLVDPGGGSMADIAGQFVNNTFTISTPAYNGDIACTASDEATRGSGNRDNGADVKCEGCMYCPFH
jgi:hypothetical protein